MKPKLSIYYAKPIIEVPLSVLEQCDRDREALREALNDEALEIIERAVREADRFILFGREA